MRQLMAKQMRKEDLRLTAGLTTNMIADMLEQDEVATEATNWNLRG